MPHRTTTLAACLLTLTAVLPAHAQLTARERDRVREAARIQASEQARVLEVERRRDRAREDKAERDLANTEQRERLSDVDRRRQAHDDCVFTGGHWDDANRTCRRR